MMTLINLQDANPSSVEAFWLTDDWRWYLPSCRWMSSSDPPPAWPHSLFSFSAQRSMMSGRWRIFPWGEHHHHGLEVHNCCCCPQSLAFSLPSLFNLRDENCLLNIVEYCFFLYVILWKTSLTCIYSSSRTNYGRIDVQLIGTSLVLWLYN